MHRDIPKPTLSRLCLMYLKLDEMLQDDLQTVSSSQLADALSINPHNVRKDIAYLDGVAHLGGGYDIAALKAAIAGQFGFDKPRKACVVGLGQMGTVILNYDQFQPHGISIVAGFDSNINKIETMRTSIPLFPSYMISETVQRLAIEFAVLTVPEPAVDKVANHLVDGGIKGIINYTSAIVKPNQDDVHVIHLSLLKNIRYLTALMTVNQHKNL